MQHTTGPSPALKGSAVQESEGLFPVKSPQVTPLLETIMQWPADPPSLSSVLLFSSGSLAPVHPHRPHSHRSLLVIHHPLLPLTPLPGDRLPSQPFSPKQLGLLSTVCSRLLLLAPASACLWLPLSRILLAGCCPEDQHSVQ